MPKPKRARRYSTLDKPVAPPAAAYTRAYEADLNHGKPPNHHIRWAGDEQVWADRYDVIHLLDALPDIPGRRVASSSSLSSSWSLPSDVEATFDLSSDEEIAEYARNRRQTWVDGLREARLREREREDAEVKAERVEKAERAENELPPREIIDLMDHTARSLAASPNAAVLEMRIMTRHSNDERFAFLRVGSRWSGEWRRRRTAAMPIPAATERSTSVLPGRGSGSQPMGLSLGYDSDSDDSSGASDSGRHSAPPPPEDTPPPSPPGPPPM